MQSSTGSPATDRDGSACWSDGSKDKLIDRRGPEWDCTVKEWMLWQWQATMHLNGKGYKATLEGENRDDATSGAAAAASGAKLLHSATAFCTVAVP